VAGRYLVKTLEAKRAFAAEMRSRPTLAERQLWEHLQRKQAGVTFHRQSVQRGYILDFYCPRLRLAVEIDGSVHDLQGGADARRERALRERGITVLRFKNRDVLDHFSGVMRRILAETCSLDSARGVRTKGRGPTDRSASSATRLRKLCNPLLEPPARVDVEPA
jgi:very-short-patch-repair endonuclease